LRQKRIRFFIPYIDTRSPVPAFFSPTTRQMLTPAELQLEHPERRHLQQQPSVAEALTQSKCSAIPAFVVGESIPPKLLQLRASDTPFALCLGSKPGPDPPSLVFSP
jgi:hypothetical protein